MVITANVEKCTKLFDKETYKIHWNEIMQDFSFILSIVGFTIEKIFSSYNIPKATASSTHQVMISDCTVTFSESSSVRGKRACNILRKCPPTQKIGITCFLSCAVRKWVFSANFCVLSEKEGDEKGDNTPFLYTLLSKTLLSSQASTLH